MDRYQSPLGPPQAPGYPGYFDPAPVREIKVEETSIKSFTKELVDLANKFETYHEKIEGDTYLIIPYQYDSYDDGQIAFSEKVCDLYGNIRCERRVLCISGDYKYSFYMDMIKKHRESFNKQIIKEEEKRNMIQQDNPKYNLQELVNELIYLVPKEAVEELREGVEWADYKILGKPESIELMAFLEFKRLDDILSYILIQFKSAVSNEQKYILCKDHLIRLDQNRNVLIHNNNNEPLIKIDEKNLIRADAIYCKFDKKAPSAYGTYETFGYFNVIKHNRDYYGFLQCINVEENEHIGLNKSFIINSEVKALYNIDKERIDFIFEANIKDCSTTKRYHICSIHLNPEGFCIESFGGEQNYKLIIQKVLKELAPRIAIAKKKLYQFIMNDEFNLDDSDEDALYDLFASNDISRCR